MTSMMTSSMASSSSSLITSSGTSPSLVVSTGEEEEEEEGEIGGELLSPQERTKGGRRGEERTMHNIGTTTTTTTAPSDPHGVPEITLVRTVTERRSAPDDQRKRGRASRDLVIPLHPRRSAESNVGNTLVVTRSLSQPKPQGWEGGGMASPQRREEKGGGGKLNVRGDSGSLLGPQQSGVVVEEMTSVLHELIARSERGALHRSSGDKLPLNFTSFGRTPTRGKSPGGEEFAQLSPSKKMQYTGSTNCAVLRHITIVNGTEVHSKEVERPCDAPFWSEVSCGSYLLPQGELRTCPFLGELELCRPCRESRNHRSLSPGGDTLSSPARAPSPRLIDSYWDDADDISSKTKVRTLRRLL